MPTIARATPDHPDILGLLAAADDRSTALYPAESRHGLSASALIAQQARFFVARDGSRAVGCGGYVVIAAQAAELKRLFVDPAARNIGIARALLLAVEHAASAEGVRTLLLETGVKSVEALGLYRKHGFTERGPFAGYRPDPLSIFMTKLLPRPCDPLEHLP